MKKTVLLFLFMFLGGASVASNLDSDPYQIDEVATIASPWRAGDVVYSQNNFIRKFLGVTKDGYYLVQEFFSNPEGNALKKSDPYLIMNMDAVTYGDQALLHALVIVYNKQGGVDVKCQFNHGSTQSPCTHALDNGETIVEFTTIYQNGIKKEEAKVYENNFLTSITEEEYDFDSKIKTGVVTYYDQSGQKEKVEVYKIVDIGEDFHRTSKTFDPDGRLIDEYDYIR